jgi:hypothetical protein
VGAASKEAGTYNRKIGIFSNVTHPAFNLTQGTHPCFIIAFLWQSD